MGCTARTMVFLTGFVVLHGYISEQIVEWGPNINCWPTVLIVPSYLMIGSPLDLVGKMKVDCPKPAKLPAIEEGNS
jgi:hypothetical protein